MFEIFSIGLPDKPPFSSLLIFLSVSLFLSVELEIIAISTLFSIKISDTLSIWPNVRSGEILTAIGILLLLLFFSLLIVFIKLPNSPFSWKSLKLSVFGDEILIVI